MDTREGEALAKEFEGLRLHAYDDATGKPVKKGDTLIGTCTIGYGHTKTARPGMTWTRQKADAMFRQEWGEFREAVLKACTIEPNPHQLGAMTCMAFNVGMGWQGAKKPKGAKDGFRQSTVLRAHNRGDTDASARAFGLWNKSGGKVNKGLTRRRKAESVLYLRPMNDEADDPMPQTVEPESSLARSPIARWGAGTIAGAGTLMLDQVRDASEKIGAAKDALGDWSQYLVILLLAALIVGGGVIVWNRIKQRREGWS